MGSWDSSPESPFTFLFPIQLLPGRGSVSRGIAVNPRIPHIKGQPSDGPVARVTVAKRLIGPCWRKEGRFAEELKILKAYIWSKSFVRRWCLSLGLVHSRTICSMVLFVLTLFGCSSRMFLSALLLANESASFESVQIRLCSLGGIGLAERDVPGQ